jgi:hypothetical protein
LTTYGGGHWSKVKLYKRSRKLLEKLQKAHWNTVAEFFKENRVGNNKIPFE